MGRAPCCEKVGLRRGRWTEEEDEILRRYIQANGEGAWRSLPKNAGLLRCGKSCRLRWINYLRADLKRGNITSEEEDTIVKLHSSWGNRWSLIAGHLPGRTDNEIKNYWNSHLSRRFISFTTPNSESTPSSTAIVKTDDTYKKKCRQTSRSTINRKHSNAEMPLRKEPAKETATIPSTITRQVEESSEKTSLESIGSNEGGERVSLGVQGPCMDSKTWILPQCYAGEETTSPVVLGPFAGQGSEMMCLDYVIDSGVVVDTSGTTTDKRQNVAITAEKKCREMKQEKVTRSEGRESSDWSSNAKPGDWFAPSSSINSDFSYEWSGWDWENAVQPYKLWDEGLDMSSWFWGSGI